MLMLKECSCNFFLKLPVQKAFGFMTGISASDQWDSLLKKSR